MQERTTAKKKTPLRHLVRLFACSSQLPNCNVWVHPWSLHPGVMRAPHCLWAACCLFETFHAEPFPMKRHILLLELPPFFCKRGKCSRSWSLGAETDPAAGSWECVSRCGNGRSWGGRIRHALFLLFPHTRAHIRALAGGNDGWCEWNSLTPCRPLPPLHHLQRE